ncbi:MAG TPA: hypothetical protein DD739_16245, partial [Ochrobactrum anthropi]|nr:hypothetical protein [Brucella anthropi]
MRVQKSGIGYASSMPPIVFQTRFQVSAMNAAFQSSGPSGGERTLSATDQPILEMRGIAKTFPGVRALDDV